MNADLQVKHVPPRPSADLPRLASQRAASGAVHPGASATFDARSGGGSSAALGALAQRANAGPHASSLAALQTVAALRTYAGSEMVRSTPGRWPGGTVQRVKRNRGLTLSLAEFQRLDSRELSDRMEQESVRREQKKLQRRLGRQARREKKHFRIPFEKSEEVNLDKWSQGHPELAGSHHKFPKRTLGWMTSRMNQEQREELNAMLYLPSDAGPAALARLRSNLIPWGPEKVASDTRLDDPEHTGESLDMVKTESGLLTPRSRTYSNLAFTYDEIRKRLQRSGEDTMSDSEARRIAEHLREAEEWHHAIEEDSRLPAVYGDGFWRESKAPRGERKWVKGRVPDAKYKGKSRETGKYEEQRGREEEQRRYESMRRSETSRLGYTPVKYLSGWEQLMLGDHWKH
jgi:hypothetical protein